MLIPRTMAEHKARLAAKAAIRAIAAAAAIRLASRR